MPSLTESLFGGAASASPEKADDAKPSAGKKKAKKASVATNTTTTALSSSPAAAAAAGASEDGATKKPSGLAGFASRPAASSDEKKTMTSAATDDQPDFFRKVAPVSEEEAKKSRRAAKEAEQPKRKKHLSHLHDEQDPDEVRRTIFISNVPNSQRVRSDLERLFRECGEVENVRIRCLRLKQQEGEKARGRGVRVLRGEVIDDSKSSAVAFILFKKASAVDLALAKSGIVFKGHHLTVAREEKESKAFLPKFSVFLGNLSRDVSDDDVWNFFLERGIKDVDRVRVIRDRDTGVAKGIGYVGFRSSASVARAITVREQDLAGRSVRICHVQKPKDPKLQVTSATRREMRRLKHQKAIMENGPTVVATKKLNKKAKAVAQRGGDSTAKTSGRREEAAAVGIQEVPAWMGATTNPRKKLAKDLRTLTQSSVDRKKAITEKRKADQERVREARKKKDRASRRTPAE